MSIGRHPSAVWRSHAVNELGGSATAAGHALARLCFETLLEYGTPALRAAEAHAVTPALERIVEANVLLSGLGFESGGLAAAHAIHNGLTVLEGAHRFLHGEKVAVGTIAQLFLEGRSRDTIEQVLDFCLQVGLPLGLSDLGLAEVGDPDLARVAEAACAPGESIHHEPFPVTRAMVMDALKAADAYGQSYR